MPKQNSLTRRFDDKKREQLAKLFRALGTDNIHEAEAARGRINSLLREYGKSWNDVIELLGGGALRADLARDIAALGSNDPDERVNARRNILELLARHRKTWNDLADVLCAHSHEAWACDPLGDDPPRDPNLVGLIHYVLEQYVALKPHEYIVVALWCLHTHIYSEFMVTPRLALRSPVPFLGFKGRGDGRKIVTRESFGGLQPGVCYAGQKFQKRFFAPKLIGRKSPKWT